MAPRKLARENASEEVKPLRVLRPKLQVAPTNNSDNKMEEKVEKRKKATKTEPTLSKAVKTASKPEPKAKAAPKPKKVAAKGHKLPDPIKPGTVFTDSAKQVWKVGKSLGSGGFGEVYSATDNLNEKIDNYKYVMKVEYSTGPLFVEQNFYIRCAKAEHLEAWKKERKVKTIGLPTFYAMRGQQEHDGNSYRFIIITKFGQDLQHLLEEHKQFSLKNTITIGCSLIDTLEYIHHSGYVHADLKPANILVGIDSTHAVVNIVDFGLATKYKDTDDNHKAHKVEKKAAHNGTLIYTSLVAHHGAVTTSRICDIEILAYNLLHFYTGSLPWASYEKQPDKVMKMKEELSEDPKKFLSTHYPSVLDMQVFVDLFEYIALSEFQDTPDYNKLKQILTKALTKNRLKFDGKLNFDDKTKSNGSTSTSAAAAKKSKAAPAKGRGKKAAPKVVDHRSEDDDDDEKDDGNDEDDEHIDDETLRFVNTNKRRVKATTAALNKLEESSEEDEEEEKPVQQKKKRRNAKETKTAPTPAETAPPSPEPEPQPSSSEVLDETFTISNPTPAMVAVMKKKAEKKLGPIRNNKARKNEKPEEKLEKDSEDEEVNEENPMDTEAYPTPAMVDVMKKKEVEKIGATRNNRANKDRMTEKVEETYQKNEEIDMDTETPVSPVMKKKENKKPAARNKKITNKDEKVEFKPIKNKEEEVEMDTESNPTPAMIEVMKKKENKKPATNNRITNKDEKLEEKSTKDKELDEEIEMDTESNPTPAMIEVMNKQQEKKPTRNNRMTSKDEKVEFKPIKDNSDEENDRNTESKPTPAMMEVMKKQEEKKPTRNNRTASKDEKIEDKTTKDKELDLLDEEIEIDTESNPTPAMIEVMKKKENKKPARNNRTTTKDVLILEEKPIEDEENGIEVESNPTPAMLEVLKKKTARNNRTTSKDEKMDEEPHITTRRGKMPRLEEKEDDEDDVMGEEEDHEQEEEPIKEDRKRKRGAKDTKTDVPSVPDVNSTFTVLTPAMMEVINKKNERKAAASKAKK